MDFRDFFRAGSSKVETRSELSIADPALAAYLGLNTDVAAGESVTATSSLGLTAVYRCVCLIAGTIAGLPLKSYRTLADGTRERVESWLDDPGGPDGPTPFEWQETLAAHLLLHGNAYGPIVKNGGGAVVGVQLLDPYAVTVKWSADVPGRREYVISTRDGLRTFGPTDFLHVPATSIGDGLRGLSPISAARNALGTAIAGDKAAARMFSNGLLIGGLVTSEDDLDVEEAKEIKRGLDAAMAGAKRAGDIAVVNRKLSFEQWTMNATDAQFIESRKHQIDEVARIFGVPKVLLAEDGASTWGSGIAELVRGMARFTLAGWTTRIEQRLSRLLPTGQFCEYDFAGILAPTPSEATENMAREIEVGLLTVEEGRRLLNRAGAPGAPATPLEENTE